MNKLWLALSLLLGLAPAQAQVVTPPDTTINCAYNTTPPTLTNGQMGRIQCGSSGYIIAASAPYVYTPLGYQQIVGAVASTTLTVPTGSIYALICIENQDVRYRDDGVAPTAAIGMPIRTNQCLGYSGSLSAFRVIETTPTSTIDVSYYK